jgi:MFS family permease
MTTPAGAIKRSVAASLWLRVVLAAAMALPMLILYAVSTLGLLLSRDLHFKPEWLGYLVMSSFGLAAVLSLWAGAFVDRLGSRYATMLLFSAVALAFTLMTTAEHFYGLAAAAAICGIAQALANPATNLLIAEQVAPKKKAGVVGLKQAGVQLAALFAGLALPGVAVAYGWRSAFGMIVPVALLFAVSTPLVAPKKHSRTGKGFAFSLPNALLLRLMGIQFCVGISLSAFVTFLPSFAAQQGMPLPLAGSLIAVFGMMGIISRIVLTPMGAKLKDESRLLLALIVLAAMAMAVTMQAEPNSHWRLWVGAVGVGLTAVGTNAIAMSMLLRDAAFGAVTAASGFVSVAFFGGFALGPPLFGNLAHYSGDPLPAWITLLGVLVCGCIMALALASARRRAAQPAAGAAGRVPLTHYCLRAAWVFAAALPLLVLNALGTLGLLRSQGLQVKSDVAGYLLLGAVGVAGVLSLLAAACANRAGSRYALLALFSAAALAVTLIDASNWLVLRFEDVFRNLI